MKGVLPCGFGRKTFYSGGVECTHPLAPSPVILLSGADAGDAAKGSDMTTEVRKPSLFWALLTLFLPVGVILYGTVWLGVRPPVLPLLAAIALAACMCLRIGFKWEELQEGMFQALGRIQIAVAILVLVGMIIAAWLASGTIPAIIYWGLKLIAPEHFLLSAMVLCSVASVATGTSFGTMGTLGVALLGVGQALGFPPAMTVGAIVSGAYLGDKMSPVSDSTNITASICEVPLFQHITSMFWTTIPAFICAAILYTIVGAIHTQGQAVPVDNLNIILQGLEANFSMGVVAFLPPVVMIVLAYMRFPVLPTMLACLLAAVIIALFQGVDLAGLCTMLTSGYASKTGVKSLDVLLSRGGIMSIMPTVLLLCSGVAFGGVLEKARVLEVLLDAMLQGATSPLRLVASTLAAGYLILLGTGSQMLAVIVPGRAFLEPFKKADVHPAVLSRTCEDAGTIGCPLIPWSVHAFYIAGVLNVTAYEFAPYAFLNWMVPLFSLVCALTGFGIWRNNGTSLRGSSKVAAA